MGEHNLLEISLVILCALGGGIFLARLKHPPILGYILAGILLGPSCLSLISDREAVSTLAELGVLMLLFSIGLELSLRSFRVVWPLAVTAMALQLVGSIGFLWIFKSLLNWPTSYTILLASIFALSSTAVAIKMLDNIGELRTTTGKIVVAILIAQDLALIPLILLLRHWELSFISGSFWAKIILGLGLLFGIIKFFSQRQRWHIPWLTRIRAEDPDLIPLVSLAICFGMAALAGVLGLSAAYGAFLSGLILGNTTERKEIIVVTHPIQSILIMVFFLSIGLLLDVAFVFKNFFLIFFLLMTLTIVKTLLNVGVLRLLKQPWPRAFLSSIVLAHIGEFSFVLASVGIESGILDKSGQKLVVSVTVLSLVFSPFWLHGARRLQGLSPGLENFREILEYLYGDLWKSITNSSRIFLEKWKQFRLKITSSEKDNG